MYFKLHPNCKLVQGAVRGALYDLGSGRVHSINGAACRLLLACRDHPIADCPVADNEAVTHNRALSFLHHLVELGLGAFDILPAEDCAASPPPDTEKHPLDFIWLEITSCCNNRCLHCYAASGPEEKRDIVPRERWLEIIAEARTLGAHSLQLIGGEPLLAPFWRDLVQAAAQAGYTDIEIFTNATLLTDDDIAFCRRYHVQIATTLYATQAAIHDAVTQNPGSFDQTMCAIRKIQQAEIPLRIASIIMRTNESEVENIVQLYRTLGLEPSPPDIVRPTGRGDDADLIPLIYKKSPVSRPFYTDPATFCRCQKWHDCLAGKVAVTSTGDVIPCIFARSQVCGNILTDSFTTLLNGQLLQKCWHTTKDAVTKCRDCEYRYACSDCRPLAQGSDPGKCWLACSPGCPYNPYMGKWEEDSKCPNSTTKTTGPAGKTP